MTWKTVLTDIKESDYFKNLWQNVKNEYQKNECYPPFNQIFRAFELTPLENVKVVIVGQDPYHGIGQANGLAFSVNSSVPAPPSLRNIFKELQEDIGVLRTTNDLEDWAKQGVMMLNASLTVEANKANSHQYLGWEGFTNEVIRQISANKKNVVFVLWGSFAQKKEELIDSSRHIILKSAHPSPLSAYRGFFGSKPFSRINTYLEETQQQPIIWG